MVYSAVPFLYLYKYQYILKFESMKVWIFVKTLQDSQSVKGTYQCWYHGIVMHYLTVCEVSRSYTEYRNLYPYLFIYK